MMIVVIYLSVRMYNLNMMKKKIAIICHSNHHIKKSLVLKKEFSSEIEIYYFKNNFLEKIKDNSLSPLSNKFISSFDIFIFYTLQTNKENIALYKLIRDAKKGIMAFQESHQLEMHGGDVNNLILQADIIFAASLAEKNGLVSNFCYNEEQVKTYGWLFSENKGDIELHGTRHQNDALLILTAPESITASSYETLSSRGELIASILELNPEKRLHIKPHPLEDISKLESIIKIFRNKKHKITLIESQKCFDDAVLSSNVIYVSNRTQSCIDLIETRKLVIYVLGPDNFITSHAKESNLEFKENSINFIEFISEESIASFKSQYINQDIKNFLNVEKLILELKSSKSIKLEHNLESILWQYIHGLLNKKSLLNLLAEDSWHNIINIVECPDNVTQNELDLVNINLSIKTSVFIIYLREIIANDILINDNITKIIKKNVTRWFAQYYPLDAIHLFFFIKNKHLEDQALEQNSKSLILNSIQILQKKSLILNLFIVLNDRISLLKIVKVKSQIFQLLNLAWGILKRY
jgi:hypothetical protein